MGKTNVVIDTLSKKKKLHISSLIIQKYKFDRKTQRHGDAIQVDGLWKKNGLAVELRVLHRELDVFW